MRPGTTFLPVLINYTFEKRGLGDIICALRAVQVIRKRWPHAFPILWVPDFMLALCRHILKDYLKELPVDYIGVFPWSEMKEKMECQLPERSFRKQNLNTWRIPLMQHNMLWMGDFYAEGKELDMPKFHPEGIPIKQFDLPKDYVVIVSTHNAANKEFYSHHIEKIVAWLEKKGLGAILLGRTEETYTHEGVVKNTQFGGTVSVPGARSLVNKTSLLEAGAIMSGAKAVIGIDGGLIHLAACTDVPIVCGFSVVRPNLFTPQRDGVIGKNYYTVEPDESLSCRFCHSQVNFINHGDVFKCFYNNDRLCLDQLTGYKFINQLKRFL